MIRVTIASHAGAPAATIGSLIARALRANGYDESLVTIVHVDAARTLSLDVPALVQGLRAAADHLHPAALTAADVAGSDATRAAVFRALADVVLESLEDRP